jgi:SAM-dependent methyltransferase
MIDFPCPICGAEDYRVIYPSTLGETLPEFGYEFSKKSRKSYRIVSCDRCRHAFCSPRPEGLYNGYQDCDYQTYLRHTVDREATAKKVLRVLRRWKPEGRLLDIGCGAGDFVRLAGQCYKAEGLEPTQALSRYANEQGLTVHPLLLKDLEPKRQYDIVSMWGVIEHFEFPSQAIAHIERLLAPGGMVCLWTGNFRGIPSRLLRKRWWYIMGQHLQLFSRTSLRILFKKYGLEEVEMRRYPYVMSLRPLQAHRDPP